VSVSRLRFNLGSLDDAGKEAFAQALYGDLRFAQALAWQKHAGVAADFDLFRSGASAASYAGIDLLGMSFFTQQATAQGEVIVDSPGGARALMFDTLQHSSGWFFTSHGYSRTGIGGLTYGTDGVAHTETNLFVGTEHGDKFMERDALLDHVDGAIRQLGGTAALDAIETLGNQIETYVQNTCPNDDAFDPCMKSVLNDPAVTGPRQQATAALETAIASLPAEQQTLVRALGQLRLAANAAHEYPAQWVGPSGSVVTNYRIDDASLADVFTTDGAARFQEALYRFLETTNVVRESSDSLSTQRAKIRADEKSKVEALGAMLTSVAAEYHRLVAAENTSVDTVGQIGPRALELRFGLDQNNQVDYDNALARSFAEGRMSTATSLFDQMYSRAGSLGPYVEQVVANGIFGAMMQDHRDIRIDIKFDLAKASDGADGHYVLAGYGDVSGYVKGAKAAAIDGGMFNIDSLLQTDQ
jgi:hypothetical protein